VTDEQVVRQLAAVSDQLWWLGTLMSIQSLVMILGLLTINSAVGRAAEALWAIYSVGKDRAEQALAMWAEDQCERWARARREGGPL
jgi:hypothetical protein